MKVRDWYEKQYEVMLTESRYTKYFFVLSVCASAVAMGSLKCSTMPTASIRMTAYWKPRGQNSFMVYTVICLIVDATREVIDNSPQFEVDGRQVATINQGPRKLDRDAGGWRQ